MPLAFTQEDFLVIIKVTTSHMYAFSCRSCFGWSCYNSQRDDYSSTAKLASVGRVVLELWNETDV